MYLLSTFVTNSLLTVFARKYGSKDKRKRVASTKKLLVKGKKRVKYNGQTYAISEPSKATQKNKKYQVVVTNTNTGKKKTVAWGDNRYQDYLTHKDKNRRKRFQKRFSGIKLKDGSTAASNPMQASYYATKYNW